jgi:Transient receptor potential (TRP) ion channel/ML-like domain
VTRQPRLTSCVLVCSLLRIPSRWTDAVVVPQGSFYVTGSRIIPSKYVDPIPSYAYTVPDLDGNAKVTLTSMDLGEEAACIQTLVGNGKSVRAKAVPYAAAGIAVAALGLSCFRALLAAERPAQEQLNIGVSGYPGAPKHPRASTRSPSFGEVIGWFQSMAMNGMYSVQYPSVYRRFTQNFAFSTGIIPWASMQMSIDSFRKATGGNLTDDSYPYIRNAILVFPSSSTTAINIAKRNSVLSNKAALDGMNTSVNRTLSGSSFSSGSKTLHFVQGVQGYVEQLSVPQANVFVTVLLTFVIIVAAIIVGILLFKAILEIWALVGSFPRKLTTFRKEYWRIIYQIIVKLILLLYSVWTLYCIFQFTHGDSWAAKLLAGVTLGTFTAILVFYCCEIWSVSRNSRKLGDDGALFDDKETWKKYNLFYADYKRGYWWLFIPAIIYMFVKGCVLATGDGHGLVQTVGLLIIELVMLILLLWSRPYILRSGNWINITIQVVRVFSVACTLVFVEQFGVTQTPKTIVGLILIGFQSFLTCILAILIAANLLITYCKENPHRKHRRRKEAERMYGDLDNLTPFDNRELLPMEPQVYKTAPATTSARFTRGNVDQSVPLLKENDASLNKRTIWTATR